jgi:malate synthase
MGGMSAYIPVKSDAEANEKAMGAVRNDKLREATDGHDGTWVAHPGLVEVAKGIFDEHMPKPNQLDRYRDEVQVTAADLLAVPQGTITEAGLRNNVRVGIQYIESWLGGQGCVPLYNLMEDAATAEICRSQVWQWLKHRAQLDDGRTIDEALVRDIVDDEMEQLKKTLGAARFNAARFSDATKVFMQVARPPDFVDFLTLPAYDRVVTGAT